MDRHRGGGLAKVVALLSAYNREGMSDDVRALAQQLARQQQNARTGATEPGRWQEKLGRLITAILNENEDHVMELMEEFGDVPTLRQALTNRRWEGWRLTGYGDN